MPLRMNGLRSFAFHRDESETSPALALSLAARPGGGAENLAVLEPERAARVLLQNAVASDSLPGFKPSEVEGNEAEFKVIDHKRLYLTNSLTVKFRQLYRGIPVYGSLITVEMDVRNRLLSINSALGSPFGVDVIARISPAQALEAVRKAAGWEDSEPPAVHFRLFFYFAAETGAWHLAYIAQSVSQRLTPIGLVLGPGTGGGDDHLLPQTFDYVIDAHTGDLVAALPRTQTAAPQNAAFEDMALDAQEVKRHLRCAHVPGKGRCLHDLERNIQTFDFEFRSVEMESILLPGQAVMSQGDDDTWDPAAVSAHANAAEVIDFLETVLLRKGIDDAGGPLISSINCVRGIGAREWRNAAWISTQMIYGQRLLNGEMRSYAISRDVVAHEIFHGVTEHTARLDCWGESGALNESYSDVFAILVTNHENSDVATWNWQIGEELDCTGLPLRDLSNPEKYGHPAHARDYRGLPATLEGDWGGVHINSTIHSKVAHSLLMVRKGKKYLFSPTTVAKLFYLTLTEHLARTSGFSDSRRGMELVARSLFRSDKSRKEKVAVIASAFDEVGIEA